MNLRSFAWAASAIFILVPATETRAQIGGQFQGGQNQAGQSNRLNNRQQPRQQKKNYLADLRTVVEAIAKRTETKILVDPSLFVAAPPKAPAAELSVDKALEQLAAPIKNSSWRRVYLQQSGNTLTPPADKLANSVRALDQLEQSGLVLENPATQKATTFVKNYAVSPSFTEELQSGQFSTTPIYILYAQTVTPESRSVEERFADLQRQQMEMMMNMSPEEMSLAMQSSMQGFMNMDPQMRAQVMGNMMQAGMQMFQNMSPEQRGQLMQGFGQFPGGVPGAPGTPSRPRRP
jgi:hypothetical protein